MNIIVTFESRGTLYVQFRDAEVVRTVELIKDTLLVDLDEHNNVLGIETLRPGILDHTLCQIPETYHLPVEAQLINFENLDRAFVMVDA